MEKGKTSTFTIYHDKCQPEKWTAQDVLKFANFVRTGDMRDAAALARLGVQLVLSDHHVPSGGALQEVGWTTPGGDVILDRIEDASDEDLAAVCRVYVGQPEYVISYGIDDGNGGYGGTEYETKPTLEAAREYIASMQELVAS